MPILCDPSTNGFVVPSGELMNNNVNLYSEMEHKHLLIYSKHVLDFATLDSRAAYI